MEARKKGGHHLCCVRGEPDYHTSSECVRRGTGSTEMGETHSAYSKFPASGKDKNRREL